MAAYSARCITGGSGHGTQGLRWIKRHGSTMGRADPIELALTDDVQCHPADPLILVLQQIHHEGVLDHVDARVVQDRDQRRIQ